MEGGGTGVLHAGTRQAGWQDSPGSWPAVSGHKVTPSRRGDRRLIRGIASRRWREKFHGDFGPGRQRLCHSLSLSLPFSA